MARGLNVDEVKTRLISLLSSSNSGLSGVEISTRLGINRVTMTKFLNVFAAEGVIKQKNIGNLNLWTVEDGTEQFQFPEDYHKVQSRYSEFLIDSSERSIYNLIRNCMNSKVSVSKLVTEVVIPSIEQTQTLFDEGKIGKSEQQLMNGIISKSIQIISLGSFNQEDRKSVILISTDSQSVLRCEAAGSIFHSDGWNVFELGDMSSAIDVLFDLDLKKLLTKIWKSKQDLMIVIVFSSTEEGLKFFSESFDSMKRKSEKNIFLILSGKIGKKIKIKCDLHSEKLEDIIQWSQTKFENLV
tara:strand:+ start:555 stop:1448 length:894 start_codon:yes stop_codon:yes gene_type:complete